MINVASTVRTYNVLATRATSVEAALAQLNKRAARKGLPLLTWTIGKAFTEAALVWIPACEIVPGERFHARSSDGSKFEVTRNVVRIPFALAGEPVQYAGWSFVAALQHLDGENIVRAIPGKECPTSYRTRGPVCDHCRMVRRRNDTYVLVHESGETVQVGSTCIADFLGSDKADRIADRATLLADAGMLLADSEDSIGFGMGGSGADLSVDYLAFVAWTVRVDGWVSRGTARESGGTASADVALYLMGSAKARAERNCQITEEDESTATAAAEWAENLSDEDVNNAKGDYLHNVRAAARTGLVTRKTAGIVGSIIIAYQHAIGRTRKAAERASTPKCTKHVGQIKQRLTWTVRLDFVTGYSTDYGYTTVLKFRTEDGALLVWKASNTDLSRDCVGKTYVVTGTITKHDNYKDEAQTLINRCKVQEVGTAVAA